MIGIVFAPVIARTVRAAVLSERELEYVAAARLRNDSTRYILFAEILPNVMGPVIVEFTVRLGYAIFTLATLSFLGFGIQPPAPDWGLQIYQHYGLISGGYWWPVVFPALGDRQPGGGRESGLRRNQPGVRAMTGAASVQTPAERDTAPALEFDDVRVDYRVRGIWRSVLRGVSFRIAQGESYGVVGESGCGKSTAAFAALRYLPRNGRVSAEGSRWAARTC